MPDMGAIAAAMSSLKTAADITKGFLDLKEVAAVQNKVIELQGTIMAAQTSAMAAQSEQMVLLDEMRTLRGRLANLEAWETEKKRYRLTDYGGGQFAYQLLESAANGEPMHRLCATCFNQGNKSLLHNNHGVWFKCLVCKDNQRLGREDTSDSYRRITRENDFF